MYTDTNYPSKAALKRALKAGDVVYVHQPGGLFPSATDGRISLEGPHFPKPHTWYAEAEIKGGAIVKLIS